MAEQGVEPRLFWGRVRGFLYRLIPAGAGPAQKERMDDRDDAGDNCDDSDDEDDEDDGHGDDGDGKFECFCGGCCWEHVLCVITVGSPHTPRKWAYRPD